MWISLILILGLALRLVSLNQSLWLDEAINIKAVENNYLPQLITQYSIADFHPPGYSILLFFWTLFSGFGETGIRIPSVIFGILAIYLIYLLGVNLKSKRVGVVAALLLSINPLHVYYSQEARPYSFALFSVVLSFYLFAKFLQSSEKKFLVYLSAANILVISSDYLPYLIFPAQLFFLILTRQFRKVIKWLISLVPAILVFSLWLPFFLQQFKIGVNTAASLPEWRDAVGAADFKSLPLTYLKFIVGRISFYNKLIYGLVFLPAGLTAGFLAVRSFFHKDRFQLLILSWLVIPIAVGFIISFFIPVYSYFRLIFVLPAFILLVSVGLTELKKVFFCLFLGIIVVCQLFYTSLYLIKPEFQREDWRGSVKFLKENNINKVLFESNGPFSPFLYYAKGDIDGVGGLKSIPAKSESDLINNEDIIKLGNTIYLYNYLIDITDPDRLLAMKLKKLGYRQKKTYNFIGVGFIYKYEK